MVFGGIGAGDQNDIGLFNTIDGIGHGTAAKRCGQTGHSGRMSETGAVIDAVGFKHRPGKFLGNVIFLVGDSGRGQHRQTVGAVFGFYVVKPVGYQIKGLFPGSFPQLTVFLDQRSGQTNG